MSKKIFFLKISLHPPFKRRANTKEKTCFEDLEAVKAQFLIYIKAVVEMDEIPHALTINWDQTGIHDVLVGSWAMEKEGSERVEIVNVKSQLYLLDLLQETSSLLNLFTKALRIDVIQQSNFLPNGVLRIAITIGQMKDYIEKILLPYISEKRMKLKLSTDYPALALF